MKQIKVVDEICGSGKSSWMYKQMVEWREKGVFEQFVYISPLLSEVGGTEVDGTYVSGRIQEEAPQLNFKYPIKTKGSKLQDVRELIVKGENIAATHSLFRLMDDGCQEMLSERKNVLIIDESVNAVEHFSGVSQEGLRMCLKTGMLLKDPDTGKLSWNHDEFPRSSDTYGGGVFEFQELVELCDSGYAYIPHTLDAKNLVVVWQFPRQLLECFDEVYVLTYMFKGSVMSAWAALNGIEIVRVKPDLYKTTNEVKERLKDLIKVYDGRAMQRVGEYSLSQSFWKNATDEEITDITTIIANMVKNNISPLGLKVEDILVTCPKSRWYKEEARKAKNKSKMLAKGKGYSRATWISSNCRATNDYADKRVMLYLLSKYPNTYIANFLRAGGSALDPDLYAIAEAVQAIFRTCIRKKEPEVLHLIMASNRMRKLFLQWLNNEGVFSEE